MGWDGAVLYQSTRLAAYGEILRGLLERKLCYPCDCSRRDVRAMGSVYDGRCRSRARPPAGSYALRLLTEAKVWGVDDRIQGRCEQNLESDIGDFVLRRKDGLFAYQLAVVVDDAFQGVNRIVRGIDLLDAAPTLPAIAARLAAARIRPFSGAAQRARAEVEQTAFRRARGYPASGPVAAPGAMFPQPSTTRGSSRPRGTARLGHRQLGYTADSGPARHIGQPLRMKSVSSGHS